MDPTWLFAVPMAVVAGVLVARRDRMRPRNAAAWLLVMAALMLAAEDGALSLWYPVAAPSVDPDGLAGIAHEHARAHMLGAGAWTFAGAGLAIALARGPLLRGERWAWRALAVYFVAGIAMDLVIYVTLYTHGVPAPVPGDHGGFGWPPIVVAILAASAGLVLARPARGGPDA